MSAAEVAAAIAEGVRAGGRNAEELPVADGGEGTADALVRALGGEWIEADATDALGRPIRGRFAMLDAAPGASGAGASRASASPRASGAGASRRASAAGASRRASAAGVSRRASGRIAVVEAAEASGLARIAESEH